MSRFYLAVQLSRLAKALMILAIHLAGSGWCEFEVTRHCGHRRWKPAVEPGKGYKIDLYV